MDKLKVEYIPINNLKTYANNAKIHTAEQIEQIKKSIEEFGMNDPIAVWKNNEIIEGHGRLIACTELGIDKVPVIRLDELTDEQRRAYMLVHNKLTMNTDFDIDTLQMELEALNEIDMKDFGFDDLEELAEELNTEYESQSRAGSMSEKYLVPPFSVIHGNSQRWLDRKRMWVSFGIHSEIGRGGGTNIS